MKKALLTVAFLFVLLGGAAGCEKQPSTETGVSTNTTVFSPEPSTSDFRLVFISGFFGTLNTFQGYFMREDHYIGMSLTSDEEKRIYDKMVEIDFFNYPNPFFVNVPPGATTAIVTPSESYYFKVEYKSQIKELSWIDSIQNSNIQADKLRELIALIRDIIAAKEEYKQLPPREKFYI